MTREAIEYFKFHRKIFCEDYLKLCPKDSIAYLATLKEKEFYDMAIKALEQEPRKGHWIDCDNSEDYSADGYDCSVCGVNAEYATSYCPNCGARMVEPQESEE